MSCPARRVSHPTRRAGLAAAVVAAALSLIVSSLGGCESEAYCFDCESQPADTTAAGTGTGGAGGEGGGLVTTCSEDGDCEDGEVCCAGVCADLSSDPEHCGECEIACVEGAHGAAVCQDGQCSFACDPGWGDCNLLPIDGCEAALSSDPLHCGGCGNACLLANAVPGCEAGQCTIASCKGGYADCNGLVPDGCEAKLGSDPFNCSACGKVCDVPPNAEPLCVAGECSKGGCLKGFGDCDGNEVNGCEIDLLTDPVHCGTCGTVCQPLPHAQPGCKGGVCAVGTCDEGYADCDQSIWSGCETVLASDVKHCGACGKPCPPVAHGTPACEGGACVIGACDPGYADCDGDPSNGCEVSLASDAEHCGACGNACPAIPNGKPICAGFQCGLGACDPGFADCFGGAEDGCETNLMVDVDHCGSCANACPTPPDGQKTCKMGVCAIASCASGYADCDGLVANGCETALADDPANCGACNVKCLDPKNGKAECSEGSCTLGECDPGYSDCDGNPANGCEFDTLSDPVNCGGCGVVCGSGQCKNAACVCTKNVLVIRDDSPSGTGQLANALAAAGFMVTQSSVPSYQYDGTNPAPDGFGAIVLLAGGPAGTSFQTDMPMAGQQAIVEFVEQKGNGLVLTEWAAYQVAQQRWTALAPLVLLTRTVAFSGLVTYTLDPAFQGHPVWAGLPEEFTFASTSNVGVTKVAPGVTRLAGSPQAIDAVAIREAPVGRVVHLAHAGNYAPNGWSNPDVQKLVANAVSWSARCP